MWIKNLSVAPLIAKRDEARSTLEFTGRDIHIINNALYRYITGGQNYNEEVCRLYADLMVVEQLMEAGVLDNWTIERVQDYRGNQITPIKGDGNL